MHQTTYACINSSYKKISLFFGFTDIGSEKKGSESYSLRWAWTQPGRPDSFQPLSRPTKSQFLSLGLIEIRKVFYCKIALCKIAHFTVQKSGSFVQIRTSKRKRITSSTPRH